ncbi:MAG: transcriptional repressor [Oscillospiraceae bacterium]|nr:transcriptional repressor [Oscillospiraceae bacterium]MBR3849995.1 transcriptional repressor [Oscillospiraceae bacterium]
MEHKAKHFKKREAILNCLRSTNTHPTAEWVYAQLKAEYPDISLGTVYRNLALFKEQGLVISVGTVNGAERFDADTEPHVHFICHRCNSVHDLPGMIVPESLTSEVDRYIGGRTESCSLSFTGTCRECLSRT